MRYHSNACTNKKQREAIKKINNLSNRSLGKIYKVTHSTINKWKKADHIEDKSNRPLTIHYALSKAEERIILKIRDHLLLSLDDLVDALSPYMKNLKRTNCYRILLRNRRNVFTHKEIIKRKEFKTYLPGFLHIDIFDLPKIENTKAYCFLAVDRATRMLFLAVYPDKTKESAGDFLIKCLKYFPFSIHTILTDNGRQFTMKGQQSFGHKSTTGTLFEIICEIAGIKYRKTKPYHPWTNGMAERMVRTVKEHTIHRERYKSFNECIKALKEFQRFHNFNRKLRVLARKSPFEKMCEFYKLNFKIFFFHPVKWKQRSETLQLIINL